VTGDIDWYHDTLEELGVLRCQGCGSTTLGITFGPTTEVMNTDNTNAGWLGADCCPAEIIKVECHECHAVLFTEAPEDMPCLP